MEKPFYDLQQKLRWWRSKPGCWVLARLLRLPPELWPRSEVEVVGTTIMEVALLRLLEEAEALAAAEEIWSKLGFELVLYTPNPAVDESRRPLLWAAAVPASNFCTENWKVVAVAPEVAEAAEAAWFVVVDLRSRSFSMDTFISLGLGVLKMLLLSSKRALRRLCFSF